MKFDAVHMRLKRLTSKKSEKQRSLDQMSTGYKW
jgi:hypothetical protein